MRRWFWAAVVVGCGGGNPTRQVALIDAAPDAPFDATIDARPDAPRDASGSTVCNVLLQTGCTAGEKCTWIHDQTNPTPIGHIGCAPDGVVALGAACMYGADGPTGYDNCSKGAVCVSGRCKSICDQNGGAPACGAGSTCGVYQGLFDISGTIAAGVCDLSCDPLADNDLLGSGTRPGSACAANQGCYGFPGTSTPTHYSCTGEFNPTLVHRSACTAAAGCAPDATHVYLNGCAQGFIPLLDEQTGSSQAVCIAYCKPADCWLGSCPNDQLRGALPHDCTTASARGAFNVASAGGTNGDQCFYSWAFEYNSLGAHIPSPTSDTVGYCIDHSLYRYDSNGNNMLDGSDAMWPRCDTLDINNGFDATFFGCVSTTTATAHGNPPAVFDALVDRPRLPFHAVAR